MNFVGQSVKLWTLSTQWMELEVTPPLSSDGGTFRARDAYHILGNKRTTIALRSGNWHSIQSWEESGCRQMEDESFLPRNSKIRVVATQ